MSLLKYTNTIEVVQHSILQIISPILVCMIAFVPGKSP